MLSILIPTYQHNITNLVNEVHTQCTEAECDFEILIVEDGSTQFLKENSTISTKTNVDYVPSANNIGRTAARNFMAEKAKYNWLLFLDADVIITKNNFISTYLDAIKVEVFDLAYGGICYTPSLPSTKVSLRWKYGKKREEKNVNQRLKSPYDVISQNILTKKETFLKSNIHLDNKYGIDIIFCNELRKAKTKILHINNTVIHQGLETNEQFLKKSLSGIETTHFYEEKGVIDSEARPLQKTYGRLKKIGLVQPLQFFVNRFRNSIQNNLLSNNPSIFLFDLYRLYYYVRLKSTK